MVRFATECDVNVCRRRSVEHTLWPHCRVCHADVCPEHSRPDTLREPEQRASSVICINCDPLDDPTASARPKEA